MPFDATPSTPLTLPPILTHSERNALLCVRDDLRSGKIPIWQFNMRFFGGLPCCIAGHARHHIKISNLTYIRDPKYNGLFGLGLGNGHAAYRANPHQAAEAIDNFLTTGNPQWDRVMATE